MGAKNELHFLEKSADKGRDLLNQYWQQRSDQFTNKWNILTREDRRNFLSSARNFLITMASGSYSSAVLYCPELNVEDLSQLDDEASSGITTFDRLLSRCLRDPSSVPDTFAHQILANNKSLKETERKAMAEMITVSRRFVLLTFVAKILSDVMGTPFEDLAPATSLLAPLKVYHFYF